MKKILIFIFILFTIFLTGCEEFSFEPLDYIHDYQITIEPNDDGTLNMHYYLKWEVLEEGDGGVSFITVGVPNRFVKNIRGLSNNIDDIYYTSSDGALIQIDFKNTYHAGDIFEVEFSFIQERFFHLNKDKVEYQFKPGWFEEIKVKNLEIRWKKDGVVNHSTNNTDNTSDEYLIWQSSLDFGETYEVNLVYNRTYFSNLNPDSDYSSQTENPWVFIIIFGVVATIFITIMIIAAVNQDEYQTCRGFSGRIHRHHFYFGRYHGYRRSGKRIETPSGGVKNAGGRMSGGCACACACACAGGGRAGCSRKDFNNYLKI